MHASRPKVHLEHYLWHFSSRVLLVLWKYSCDLAFMTHNLLLLRETTVLGWRWMERDLKMDEYVYYEHAHGAAVPYGMLLMGKIAQDLLGHLSACPMTYCEGQTNMHVGSAHSHILERERLKVGLRIPPKFY